MGPFVLHWYVRFFLYATFVYVGICIRHFEALRLLFHTFFEFFDYSYSFLHLFEVGRKKYGFRAIMFYGLELGQIARHENNVKEKVVHFLISYRMTVASSLLDTWFPRSELQIDLAPPGRREVNLA